MDSVVEGEDCDESTRRSEPEVEGQPDEAHSDVTVVDGIAACAAQSRGLVSAVVMAVVTYLEEERRASRAHDG